MASELASLPLAVLNGVVSFTGNTYANSNIIDGISSTSSIRVGMYILGTGIAPNSTIDFVSTNSIQISIAATANGTATSLNAGFESYAASKIYRAVPQFMQDLDSQTGLNNNPSYKYILYRFIKAMVTMLDEQVNVVARYGIGANGYRDDKYALAPNWSNLLDINRCPDWALPWLAQFVGVTFTNIDDLSYATKIDKIKNRSSYVRGTLATLQNAIVAEINTAPHPNLSAITASQVLIMEQTMPYTVSFIGSVANGSASITNATISGLSNGMYLYGTGIPSATTITGTSGTSPTATVTMSANGTVAATSSLIKAVSKTQFVPEQYSMVILIPNVYLANYTYATLNQGLGLTNPNYLQLDNAINVYSTLSSDPVAKTNSSLSSFIYKYRPAGVQVYIGGY